MIYEHGILITAQYNSTFGLINDHCNVYFNISLSLNYIGVGDIDTGTLI